MFLIPHYCRSLGMCRKCGDLKSVACGRCKGTGRIKSGGFFGFSDSSNARSVACDNCQAKGCFPCPECSKSWPFSRYFIDCLNTKTTCFIFLINVIGPLVMLKLKHGLSRLRSLLFQFLISCWFNQIRLLWLAEPDIGELLFWLMMLTGSCRL